MAKSFSNAAYLKPFVIQLTDYLSVRFTRWFCVLLNKNWRWRSSQSVSLSYSLMLLLSCPSTVWIIWSGRQTKSHLVECLPSFSDSSRVTASQWSGKSRSCGTNMHDMWLVEDQGWIKSEASYEICIYPWVLFAAFELVYIYNVKSEGSYVNEVNELIKLVIDYKE